MSMDMKIYILVSQYFWGEGCECLAFKIGSIIRSIGNRKGGLDKECGDAEIPLLARMIEKASFFCSSGNHYIGAIRFGDCCGCV